MNQDARARVRCGVLLGDNLSPSDLINRTCFRKLHNRCREGLVVKLGGLTLQIADAVNGIFERAHELRQLRFRTFALHLRVVDLTDGDERLGLWTIAYVVGGGGKWAPPACDARYLEA